MPPAIYSEQVTNKESVDGDFVEIQQAHFVGGADCTRILLLPNAALDFARKLAKVARQVARKHGDVTITVVTSPMGIQIWGHWTGRSYMAKMPGKN